MSGFQKPFFCEKSGIPVAQGDGDKKQCPRDPYYIATDSSEYIDFQILKIQEAPDVIPTGEIPRTYQMCVDRFMVDQLNPGTRCTVTGIYTVSGKTFKDKKLKFPRTKNDKKYRSSK